MSKFSLQKEMADRLRECDKDFEFHNRALKRINTEIEAITYLELKRTGNIGKEIKNVDFEKGEIEIGDIIKKPTEGIK